MRGERGLRVVGARSGTPSGKPSTSTTTSTRVPRSSSLRIRRAGVADASRIAAVMRAAVRGVTPGTYPARTLAAWASLPALYHAWAMTAGGEAVLVAERRGAVVGYAALRGAELTALFVSPAAGRRGVASALLVRIEALARRRGVRRLRVDAALSGVDFYRARGFGGGRALRVPLPGGSMRAVRLAKGLTGTATSRQASRPR